MDNEFLTLMADKRLLDRDDGKNRRCTTNRSGLRRGNARNKNPIFSIFIPKVIFSGADTCNERLLRLFHASARKGGGRFGISRIFRSRAWYAEGRTVRIYTQSARMPGGRCAVDFKDKEIQV
jgi:hypothetical protein